MPTIKLKGFPDQISEYIELPDIAELMCVPMCQMGDIDYIYKQGGELYRYLIDHTPISTDKKYINIWGTLSLLKPGKDLIKYGSRWHSDGSALPGPDGDRFHLMVSPCTSRTQFNLNPLEYESPDGLIDIEFDKYLDAHASEIGIIPKQIESNQIVTFTSEHVHRAISPLNPEFRFVFRVCESNDLKPIDNDHAFISHSSSYFGPGKSAKNIERFKDGILIHP
jgi:hypothetical protein